MSVANDPLVENEEHAARIAGLKRAHQLQLKDAAERFRKVLCSGENLCEVYEQKLEPIAKFLFGRDVKILCLEGMSNQDFMYFAKKYVDSRLGF